MNGAIGLWGNLPPECRHCIIRVASAEAASVGPTAGSWSLGKAGTAPATRKEFLIRSVSPKGNGA